MNMAHTGNILDPIHAELSDLVWDNPASPKPVLKPVHAHWIKSKVYTTLEHAGYTDIEKWLTLVLTGSICTYQYSNESDIDISLFIDSVIFPEWSRAEMIALMVDKLDGTTLPGTPFPLQDFVVSEGIKPNDLYKPGLRSGYNIDTNKWIVPPERSRVHDVKAEQGGFYAWSLQMADKMERLLRYEPDAAVRFWHSIHKKRQRDMQAGKGDFAESNIVYKALANRGLFPKLSEASGEYIAKTGMAGEETQPFFTGNKTGAVHFSDKIHLASIHEAGGDWFAPSYMIPDDAKQQIHEWAQTLPWPEGSRLAPPDRYHVTGIYSPSGFSDPEHQAWVQSHSGLTYPVQTIGVDNFSPSKVDSPDAPVVLRVHHPQLKADTEQLIDEAQKRGLPVSRFPGGYKAHVTVGHSPTPIQAEHPGLSFPVGPLRDLHGYYDELKSRQAKTAAEAGYSADLWHGPHVKNRGIFSGMFLTSHKPEAEDYSHTGEVFPVHVQLANPVHYYENRPPDAVDKARESGNDGVVVHYNEDLRDPSMPLPARDWTIVLDPSTAHMAKTAKKEKPPHLKEAKGDKCCDTCWAFKKGHCEMFGGYKVREDQTCDDWEAKKEKKTATIPTGWTTMYHVSPRKNRERILDEGLQGHEKSLQRGSPWDYTWSQPAGNYLFDSPEHAHAYVHHLHTNALGHELRGDGHDADQYLEDRYEWPDDEDGEPIERNDDPEGYDIYSVQAHGLPIAPDPETEITNRELNTPNTMGFRPDAR